MTDTHPAAGKSTPLTMTPLTVYDGQTLLGRIVHRGNSFEALDIDGASYGVFADMKAAAFALPTRRAP
jgi:hypothetical protein